MREKLLVTGAGLILVYLAWAWGGLQQIWQIPAVCASACLLIGLLTSTSSRRKSLWRDYFFYGGLLFLGYLAIQSWNAGRVLFFDVGLREWRYSAPPHPGWPSAFSRADAAEMLTWFFPAWVLGLVVRSPGIGSRPLLKLLRALVYGAGLLSLMGIIQFVTHAKARYWVRPTHEFFASFGYTNHAAAYFVLMGAVAAGLLFREIFRSDAFKVDRDLRARSVHTGFLLELDAARRSASTHEPVAPVAKTRMRVGALAVSLVLCLVGANLSLSRAGVILAWALAGFVAVYGLIRGWNRLSAVRRLNLAVATVAVLFVFYFAVAGFGKKEILHEFDVKKPIHHRLFTALDNVNLAMGGRLELDQAGWRIWQDHKLLGIGGWGFRYLLALYFPPEEWKVIAQNPGKANVHCDILQFLAEFGVVGFGLMLVAVWTLIGAIFQRACRRDPLWIMGVIGLSLVFIFSLIDLPFRCPAILCTWVVVLAALPKATEVRIQESEIRIHNNR
jgi:hypothetical protein